MTEFIVRRSKMQRVFVLNHNLIRSAFYFVRAIYATDFNKFEPNVRHQTIMKHRLR